MPCLLSEIRFWSSIDDVLVQDTDYGAFKYFAKKDVSDSVQALSKKGYCEQRGVSWNINNKRPFKLRNKIKELEEHLLQNKVVTISWEGSNIQILLSRGIRIIININQTSCDINNITFDKSLTTKIQNECIYDGVMSGSQVICATSDCRIIGHGSQWQDGWTIESGCKRKLSLHGELLVVWGRTGAENPQPWSPLNKEHQRANLHLYWVGARGPDLLTYKKTDGEPILVVVSRLSTKTLIIVEQKVSQRGAVSVEVSMLVLLSHALKRASVTAVPLQTQVSCCALSHNENNLILGCIDGSVAILDRYRGSTKITKAAFIPTLVTWNTSGAVAVLSNEKGQVQYFDTSLNCLKVQLLSEDSTPVQLIDLSVFFNIQPTIDAINWGSKDLLIVVENGPIVVITHVEKSLKFLSLVQRYLNLGKVDKAISLLASWNWNDQCFCALQRIVTHLMQLPLTEENTNFLQKALGCYHSPNIPLNTEIRHKFGRQVKAMTRRFFHQLVRNKMFETAFLLAVDLAHHDLFMDLHFVAVQIGETEMAAAARAQASALLSRCSSAESDCSRSSCSQCSAGSSSSDDLSVGDGNDLQTTSFNCLEQLPSVSNDNYLTTNFNSATPKTYKPSATYVPPIPNIDLPKVNFSKIHTVKTTLNEASALNKNIPLIPPPLPVASLSSPKALNTPLGPHVSAASSTNLFSSLSSNFEQFRPFPTNVSNHPSLRHVNPPPLPITSPLILNPSVSLTQFNSNKTSQNMSSPLQLYSNATSLSACSLPPPTIQNVNSTKKPPAKVKFSDTVTAFIVPEIKRPVRPAPPAHVTDPQKELADSLPLCHPNEDYLKDFTPVQRSEPSDPSTQPKIKVVHFGVV